MHVLYSEWASRLPWNNPIGAVAAWLCDYQKVELINKSKTVNDFVKMIGDVQRNDWEMQVELWLQTENAFSIWGIELSFDFTPYLDSICKCS